MAGVAGLEPTHAGFRIQCLTNLAIALYEVPLLNHNNEYYTENFEKNVYKNNGFLLKFVYNMGMKIWIWLLEVFYEIRIYRRILYWHSQLFEIANRAYELLTNKFKVDKYDEIADVLEELKDYTKYHFGHEEEYMKSINYGKRFSQMRQHAQFIEKLESYDLKNIDENQQAGLLEIIDFLAVWLQGHIKGMDKRIPKVEA